MAKWVGFKPIIKFIEEILQELEMENYISGRQEVFRVVQNLLYCAPPIMIDLLTKSPPQDLHTMIYTYLQRY